MPFPITLEALAAARHVSCSWTAEDLIAGVQARFPGVDPVDLGALCRAWANDQALTRETLQQAIMMVRTLGVPKDIVGNRYLFDPAAALITCADWFDAQGAPPPPP